MEPTNGAASPYGFEFHEGHLIRNAKELSTVQRIVELKSKGFGVTDIARKLNALKIRNRAGTDWEHSLVSRIIRRFEEKDSPYQEILKLK